MAPDRYDTELERRLAAVEDAGDDDPARRDLPRADLLVVAIGVVVVVVVMWLWGYPG